MTTDLKNIGVSELPLVGPAYAKKLNKLGIISIWDLFHHIPTRFLDFSKSSPIAKLQIDEIATIHGTIRHFTNTYTKTGKTMQIVTVEDVTGKVDAIWFNQIYLSNTFKEGAEVSLAGKLTFIGRKKAIIAPEYEIVRDGQEQIHTSGLIPIYAETAGISSKWLRRKIHDAWKRYQDDFEEFLSKEILKKYDLIDFKTAIHDAHFPENMEGFEKAKHRLSFNEVLSLHLLNMKRKKEWEENVAEKLDIKTLKIDKFVDSLKFELTNSQNKVVKEILADLGKDLPMNRLLEGDVGSGKTIVAAIAAYAVFLSGKKTVFMAPTQILAMQHFHTLTKLFTDLKVGILTGTKKTVGDFNVIVGTHALLQSKVDMTDVALFVIDEQHKFGVEQRNLLVKKSKTPHILTMTATPIPRSVALTFFGDLDLSILDEMPHGRQKITTWIVPEIKRENGFNWIHDKIVKEKIQAYIVCPLIDESVTETMTDVKAASKEYEKLQNKFPDLKIGLMHGKLKVQEKEDVITKFKNGETDILVTTAIVEVGIDIPNATIMVIEAADRFGLASLHQLRGRVGRGNKKSYCFLMTENMSEKTQTRLAAMTKYNSGFKLAELDLAMRGPGEIYGARQSGIPELKIADWSDTETIKATRIVAHIMVQ